MTRKPHVLVVEARFYEDIADFLVAGALQALEKAGATCERISVPGALEIPAVIKMASKITSQQKKFDAFVALGCVIRGETSHYDIVAGESARGLMDLGLGERPLCIGNGILTCETRAQAIKRADPAQKNKGRDAVHAALGLFEIQKMMEQG